MVVGKFLMEGYNDRHYKNDCDLRFVQKEGSSDYLFVRRIRLWFNFGEFWYLPYVTKLGRHS